MNVVHYITCIYLMRVNNMKMKSIKMGKCWKRKCRSMYKKGNESINLKDENDLFLGCTRYIYKNFTICVFFSIDEKRNEIIRIMFVRADWKRKFSSEFMWLEMISMGFTTMTNWHINISAHFFSPHQRNESEFAQCLNITLLITLIYILFVLKLNGILRISFSLNWFAVRYWTVLLFVVVVAAAFVAFHHFRFVYFV